MVNVDVFKDATINKDEHEKALQDETRAKQGKYHAKRHGIIRKAILLAKPL